MNVIRHNAQSIEFKTVFIQPLANRIKKHLPAFPARQPKLPIITARRNVVSVSWLENSRFSRHSFFPAYRLMTYPNLLIANPKDLQFIGEHKNAFDLEYLYPLDIFEDLVAQVEPCRIECSCKIEDDKLDPARFNLAINDSFARNAKAFLDFFHQVETRVGITLNYQPLHLFMNGFDYSKVTQIMAGIDARTDLAKARVKTWWAIHNYPEKLETAITLANTDSKALRMLLELNSSLVVGFHLYLKGDSEVRLYPSVSRQEFEKITVQAQLAKILSDPALKLLEDCGVVSLVLKEDGDKILHYHVLPEKVNLFIDNLRSSMATRAHAPYREQSISLGVTVSLSEKELLSGSLKTINLYYMNQYYMNQ